MKLRAVLLAGQHERLHAMADQRSGLLQLALRIESVGREDHAIADLAGAVLEGLQKAGEDRIIQRRHHGADHLGAPHGERARRRIRHVVEPLDGGPNA